MLQAGDADNVTVNIENRPQVEPQVGVTCVYNTGTADFDCTQTGEADGLRMYRGHPLITRWDVFFNFDIVR
jgi:hypothetical protein